MRQRPGWVGCCRGGGERDDAGTGWEAVIAAARPGIEPASTCDSDTKSQRRAGIRSARSAVMFSGLTVNSIRLANRLEKLKSTTSTDGWRGRRASPAARSMPKPSGPAAPRTIQGAAPKPEPSTSGSSWGWPASRACAPALFRPVGCIAVSSIAARASRGRGRRRFRTETASWADLRLERERVDRAPVPRNVNPPGDPQPVLGRGPVQEALDACGPARVPGQA